MKRNLSLSSDDPDGKRPRLDPDLDDVFLPLSTTADQITTTTTRASPKSPLPALGEAAIKIYSGASSYDAGNALYNSGKVDGVLRCGSLIRGRVAQMTSDLYADEKHPGTISRVECSCGGCTNSGGQWCSHVVASLLFCASRPHEVLEYDSIKTKLNGLSAKELQTLMLNMLFERPAFGQIVGEMLPDEDEGTFSFGPPQDITVERVTKVLAAAPEIGGPSSALAGTDSHQNVDDLVKSALDDVTTAIVTFGHGGGGAPSGRIGGSASRHRHVHVCVNCEGDEDECVCSEGGEFESVTDSDASSLSDDDEGMGGGPSGSANNALEGKVRQSLEKVKQLCARSQYSDAVRLFAAVGKPLLDAIESNRLATTSGIVYDSLLHLAKTAAFLAVASTFEQQPQKDASEKSKMDEDEESEYSDLPHHLSELCQNCQKWKEIVEIAKTKAVSGYPAYMDILMWEGGRRAAALDKVKDIFAKIENLVRCGWKSDLLQKAIGNSSTQTTSPVSPTTPSSIYPAPNHLLSSLISSGETMDTLNARLEFLEVQGRLEECLSLAVTMNMRDRAAKMLILQNRTNEAVDTFLEKVSSSIVSSDARDTTSPIEAVHRLVRARDPYCALKLAVGYLKSTSNIYLMNWLLDFTFKRPFETTTVDRGSELAFSSSLPPLVAAASAPKEGEDISMDQNQFPVPSLLRVCVETTATTMISEKCEVFSMVLPNIDVAMKDDLVAELTCIAFESCSHPRALKYAIKDFESTGRWPQVFRLMQRLCLKDSAAASNLIRLVDIAQNLGPKHLEKALSVALTNATNIDCALAFLTRKENTLSSKQCFPIAMKALEWSVDRTQSYYDSSPSTHIVSLAQMCVRLAQNLSDTETNKFVEVAKRIRGSHRASILQGLLDSSLVLEALKLAKNWILNSGGVSSSYYESSYYSGGSSSISSLMSSLLAKVAPFSALNFSTTKDPAGCQAAWRDCIVTTCNSVKGYDRESTFRVLSSAAQRAGEASAELIFNLASSTTTDPASFKRFMPKIQDLNLVQPVTSLLMETVNPDLCMFFSKEFKSLGLAESAVDLAIATLFRTTSKEDPQYVNFVITLSHLVSKRWTTF